MGGKVLLGFDTLTRIVEINTERHIKLIFKYAANGTGFERYISNPRPKH
jgi:hypothetical protein